MNEVKNKENEENTINLCSLTFEPLDKTDPALEGRQINWDAFEGKMRVKAKFERTIAGIPEQVSVELLVPADGSDLKRIRYRFLQALVDWVKELVNADDPNGIWRKPHPDDENFAYLQIQWPRG